MKLHFSVKKQLKPILTAGMPRRQGDRLYTQYNDSIVVTDVHTLEILREIPFGSIRCFDLGDRHMVVCSEDIVVYDLLDEKTVATVSLSKVDVCSVLIDEISLANEEDKSSVGKFHVIVGKVDGSVSMVDVVGRRPVWSYKMAGSITHLKRFDGMVCSADRKELWIYGNRGDLMKYSQPNIVGISFNRVVYTLTSSGVLTRWGKTPRETLLNMRCSSMMGDDRFLYVGGAEVVYVYDYDGKLQYTRNMLSGEKTVGCEGSGRKSRWDKSEEMSLEDESGVDSRLSSCDEVDKESRSREEDSHWDDESCSDRARSRKRTRKAMGDMREQEDSESGVEIGDEIVIESMSGGVISTTEQEIFLVDEDLEVTSVIIGNNDEITDIKPWKDVLFVATNSGRLRYTFVEEYGDGEYAFRGCLVPAHREAIMSLSVCENFLMTTSRDKRTVLWRIAQDPGQQSAGTGAGSSDGAKRSIPRIVVKRIRTIENTLDGQNACALGSSVFVMGGSDQILQIWDYRDNVFMEKIHSKEINNVEINEERRLIATSSQDRTAKILDFHGRVLHTLGGHTKGVWSTCFGRNMVATLSADSTVKLWTMDTFTCVGTLAGHRSAVLKGSFYMNDEFLISGCATGEIKVWNVRKKICEMNIAVHRDKVWALVTAPKLITSGNGAIGFFEDDSVERSREKLRVENEKAMQDVEVERCLRNNLNVRAVEILSKANDQRSLFKTLVRCYEEKPGEVFDILEHKQKMFFETILRQGTFKNGAVVHWLLKEALKRGWRSGGDITDKIHRVVEKHSDLVDEMYSDLLGLTIFQRPFN